MYKLKWIETPELKTMAESVNCGVRALVDRDSQGNSCGGAYGSNVESKLRVRGFGIPMIMDALATAFGWDWEDRMNYPECDQ